MAAKKVCFAPSFHRRFTVPKPRDLQRYATNEAQTEAHVSKAGVTIRTKHVLGERMCGGILAPTWCGVAHRSTGSVFESPRPLPAAGFRFLPWSARLPG